MFIRSVITGSLTVILFSLLAIPVMAQENNVKKEQDDADKFLSLADKAYQEKQYQQCADNYLAAIKLGMNYANVYYNAACCLALSGQVDAAFKSLNSAIDDGYINTEHMNNDSDLASLKKDARWQQALDKCQAQIAKLNQPLRAELFSMTKIDQEIRNKLGGSQNEKLLEQMIEIDKKNTARMREIIKQYGWPGKSLVGKDGAGAAWLLVQHADNDREFQKECLLLMKAALAKDEVAKPNFALLTDRVLLAEGKKQLYGSQFQLKDGQYVPFPIEDEANVDARRHEMGLEPLAEYAEKLRQVYQSDEE